MKLMRMIRDESGMGTVEVVLIAAVLVGLALIFKESIVGYLNTILSNINGVEIDPKEMGVDMNVLKGISIFL